MQLVDQSLKYKGSASHVVYDYKKRKSDKNMGSKYGRGRRLELSSTQKPMLKKASDKK